MKGIDCTVQITPAYAKALKAAGIGFVARYLVPVSMVWKRLTKAEVEAMSVEDIKILSIFESTANRARLGKAAGESDGKTALAEAKVVRQPTGSAIYFAVDYDAQPKDYDLIYTYLQAAQAQISGYFVGVYGSYAVCEEMAKRGIKYFWQTYAWSKGKKSAHANVYQYKNGVTVAGISCDADESYGNEGFWNLKPVVINPALDIVTFLNSTNPKVINDTALWVKKAMIDKDIFNLMVNIKNYIEKGGK